MRLLSMARNSQRSSLAGVDAAGGGVLACGLGEIFDGLVAKIIQLR